RKMGLCARLIGTWTFGRFESWNSVGRSVLTGQIASPGVRKADPQVSLGIGKSGNANCLGDDAKGTQQGAELLRRQRLAASPLNPRTFGIGSQCLQQIGRAHGVVAAKCLANVRQQFDTDRGLIVFAGESLGGIESAAEPFAAGLLGND